MTSPFVLRLLAMLTLSLSLVRASMSLAGYVVSPQASEQTKAAVAAGNPPQHGFPSIDDVDWKLPTRLHPGTEIQAVVRTSLNVGYVEGRVKYWNIKFDQTAPGTFRLDFRVPLLPPTALGHWTLEVIARSVDGVEVERTFPVIYTYL